MDNNVGLITAGVTAFTAAVAYVLWGFKAPSIEGGGSKHSRGPSGTIPGLVNSGNTCFVNSLLQALASLSHFYDWIRRARSRASHSYISAIGYDATSPSRLVDTLEDAVSALNDKGGEAFAGSVYDPTCILECLRRCGWVIPTGEQDLHEFFHVLIDTIEENMKSQRKLPSICDAMAAKVGKIADRLPQYSILSAAVSPGSVGSNSTMRDSLKPRRKRHTIQGIHFRSKFDSSDEDEARSLLSSKWATETPFQGLLASQLVCKTCGHKTAVRHDAFSSLSLSLPDFDYGFGLNVNVKQDLNNLLRGYFSSDTVNDVHCSRCTALQAGIVDGVGGGEGTGGKEKRSVKRSFIKDTSVGKLPKCLCLHIKRTYWLPDGRCIKRADPVEFHEYLDMEEFVFKPRLMRRRSIQQNSVKPYGIPSSTATTPTSPSPRGLTRTVSVDGRPTSVYQLKAVVEHLGGLASGHFVTYRKGPLGSDLKDSWFYTSDVRVQPTTKTQVFRAVAYILFYERVLAL